MRIFKKSLALALVAAMVLSLVSFGVFAEATTPALTFVVKGAADATTTISSAKAGKTVWVDVCLTPGAYSTISVELTPKYTVTAADVTVNYTSMATSPINGANVQYGYPMAMTITDTPLMTVKMTIPEGTAAGNIDLFSYVQSANVVTPAGGTLTDLAVGSSAFTVQDAFTAGYVVNPSAINVTVGTAEADLDLPEKVTVRESEEGTKADTNVSVDWSCADYDGTAVGTYTFTGELSVTDANSASLPEDNEETPEDEELKATVTVNVNAATTIASNNVPNPVKIYVKADETAYTDEELTAAVAEELGAITVTGGVGGAITDTYTNVAADVESGAPAVVAYTVAVVADASNAATAAGDQTKIKITLASASDNGKFALTGTDAEIETVVELKKKSSGSVNVGGLGVAVGGNTSTGGTSTGTDVEEPGTDVEEPGTDVEEPGTDVEEPGTEEPGTEEPGIDVPATSFEDVPADHWAYEYIEGLKEAGIVGGKTATTFEPDAVITRAEFAKMVAVAKGLDATTIESAFEDCGADDWYTPYVVACAEAGYIKGISETEYGADQLITRQDICTILGRVLGLDAAEAEAAFADVDDIADYALNAVKALAAAGVVNGYEDGSFGPAKNAIRAEVAKILSSVLAMVEAEETPAEEDAVVEEETATEEEVVEEETTVEEEVVEEDAVVEEETITEEEVVEEEAAEETDAE